VTKKSCRRSRRARYPRRVSEAAGPSIPGDDQAGNAYCDRGDAGNGTGSAEKDSGTINNSDTDTEDEGGDTGDVWAADQNSGAGEAHGGH
jgi:hypothetical protein